MSNIKIYLIHNMKINNIDLYFNKYDENILIENIDNLIPMSIIKTQKNLSKEFIDKYILPNNISTNDEDEITMSILQQMQPKYFENEKKSS